MRSVFCKFLPDRDIKRKTQGEARARSTVHGIDAPRARDHISQHSTSRGARSGQCYAFFVTNIEHRTSNSEVSGCLDCGQLQVGGYTDIRRYPVRVAGHKVHVGFFSK